MVCSQIWHLHVLPVAKLLTNKGKGHTHLTMKQASSQNENLRATSKIESEGLDDTLDKVLELLAIIMVKCKFSHLRPLVAVATLLFHSASQPFEQP